MRDERADERHRHARLEGAEATVEMGERCLVAEMLRQLADQLEDGTIATLHVAATSIEGFGTRGLFAGKVSPYLYYRQTMLALDAVDQWRAQAARTERTQPNPEKIPPP